MPTFEFVIISVCIFILASLRFFRGGVAVVSSGIDVSKTKTIMAIIVSLVVLFSALYVVLSGRYAGDSEKWAFGAVGTIVGFWLRSEK
jgi:hypothetical protein